MTTLGDDALIPIDQGCKTFFGGISKQTYWRLAKQGRLPKQIKLGKFTSRLSVRECREYVERLKAERD